MFALSLCRFSWPASPGPHCTIPYQLHIVQFFPNSQPHVRSSELMEFSNSRFCLSFDVSDCRLRLWTCFSAISKYFLCVFSSLNGKMSQASNLFQWKSPPTSSINTRHIYSQLLYLTLLYAFYIEHSNCSKTCIGALFVSVERITKKLVY